MGDEQFSADDDGGAAGDGGAFQAGHVREVRLDVRRVHRPAGAGVAFLGAFAPEVGGLPFAVDLPGDDDRVDRVAVVSGAGGDLEDEPALLGGEDFAVEPRGDSRAWSGC